MQTFIPRTLIYYQHRYQNFLTVVKEKFDALYVIAQSFLSFIFSYHFGQVNFNDEISGLNTFDSDSVIYKPDNEKSALELKYGAFAAPADTDGYSIEVSNDKGQIQADLISVFDQDTQFFGIDFNSSVKSDANDKSIVKLNVQKTIPNLSVTAEKAEQNVEDEDSDGELQTWDTFKRWAEICGQTEKSTHIRQRKTQYQHQNCQKITSP